MPLNLDDLFAGKLAVKYPKPSQELAVQFCTLTCVVLLSIAPSIDFAHVLSGLQRARFVLGETVIQPPTSLQRYSLPTLYCAQTDIIAGSQRLTTTPVSYRRSRSTKSPRLPPYMRGPVSLWSIGHTDSRLMAEASLILLLSFQK